MPLLFSAALAGETFICIFFPCESGNLPHEPLLGPGTCSPQENPLVLRCTVPEELEHPQRCRYNSQLQILGKEEGLQKIGLFAFLKVLNKN